MKTVYNIFNHQPYFSKYGVNVSIISDVFFMLSFVIGVASIAFLILSLVSINHNSTNNLGFFVLMILTAYGCNVYAKKNMHNKISADQIDFLVKHQQELGIETINKNMTKLEIIPYLDKAYEIDQIKYEQGERQKDNFMLHHNTPPKTQ